MPQQSAAVRPVNAPGNTENPEFKGCIVFPRPAPCALGYISGLPCASGHVIANEMPMRVKPRRPGMSSKVSADP